MKSVATKLLLMTLLPSLAAGTVGLWVLYGLTDRTVRDAMVSTGWVAEGDGDDLVVMCAPGAIAASAAVTTTDPPLGGGPMDPPPPMYCTPDPYGYGCSP